MREIIGERVEKQTIMGMERIYMLETTKILSQYVENLKFNHLTEQDLRYTRMLILDYFAASCGGKKLNRVFNEAIESIFFDMGGSPESTVLFSKQKLPAQSAAILNATYAHGADMDDGHKRAMGHVGAHVFSAVFALAETLQVTEQEVMEAIVAGYEVYIRISAAAQPGLARRGFHSTGTAGGIACAAACAKLLKLDAVGIHHAMAIGATQGSGLLIVAESGQMVKPINPAKAAQTGILSALLAQRGVIGAAYPLESKKGWFHAMADQIDESMIIKGLGERNEISQCYLKPYPSCRHTHCGIEGAVRIYGRNKGKQVSKVNLYIYQSAIQIAGQITHPETDDDAKFSIHYTLACALAHGGFGLDDLNMACVGAEVNDLIDKINLIHDPDMENRERGIRGARIQVLFADGTVDEETIPVPKGDPEVPFTLDDMRKKLSACCKDFLDEKGQNHLVERVLEFGRGRQFTYATLIG